MQGQYEQVVNGHLLATMQLGKNVLEVTPDAIALSSTTCLNIDNN